MNADQGYDPRTGAPVGSPVPHTDAETVDRLCRAAAAAAPVLGATSPAERAAMLRAVSEALGAHAEEIVTLADAETALGRPRLTGELARTRGQLEMFADALIEGSFLEVVIDPPNPRAKPTPRPDLRRMLVPLGPVAVYAASNFPLAFSVAGGDTASALAAGCPVVVKAHPGHPGLSTLTGRIVGEALTGAGAPAGTFAVVHGLKAGRDLVRHPAIRAAGFTGSLAGGRALHDLAASRPDPIPFYGELGAINPVVVTPGAAAERADDIVAGFVSSFTLGSGQFCTKPGLVLLPAGHGLVDRLTAAACEAQLGPVVNERIKEGFEAAAAALAAVPGVRSLLPESPSSGPGWQVTPRLFATSAASLREHAATLLEECFGPASLLVEYDTVDDLLETLDVLPGSLTGTLHAAAATEADLAAEVTRRLAARAGRVIVGGWPTGVAVTWAMQHGGPWPATTNALHTSVGVTALRRWLRPVVYQDAPQEVLPPPLRDDNPWGVPRRVDGVLEPGRAAS